MRRIIKFQSLQNHPWYSRLFSRLNANEKAFCEYKIKETAHFSDDEFCQMAQRFGHTAEEQVFKNHKIINELLLVAGGKG